MTGDGTLTTTDAVNMLFTFIGLLLILVALWLHKPRRPARMNILGISLALVGTVPALLTLSGRVPFWIPTLTSSFVFGQGAFYSMKAWASRGVAASVEKSSPDTYAVSVPDILRDANIQLREKIERARKIPYFMLTIAIALLPLAVVALVKYQEAL